MPKAVAPADQLTTLQHYMNENFFEVQRRLDELLKFQDRAKTNFLDVERKLVEFDQKLGAKPPVPTEIPDVARLEEKIKSLEDMLMLLELEVVRAKERMPTAGFSELEATPKIPTIFEDRLKTLEEKFGMLEKLKLKMPVELVQHEPRLKSIENNVITLQHTMHEEISRVENMVSGRAVTEQSSERFVEKMREEMSDLRRDIEKAELLKNEILAKERSFATRPDLEAFETRIRSEISSIHNISDRVAAAEKSLDTMLVDIEDKLTTEVNSHRKTFDNALADLESALRTEFETHRHAFDNKIADLEERITKVAAETAITEAHKDVEIAIATHRKDINELIAAMQAELAKIKPILTAEKVSALMKRVNTIERDLESRASAIVTKELASFAEAIDRKFPDLVTKADFSQWSRAVAQRIQTIEAPDISPLADRIDKLELRLNELGSLIREIAVRMPIVVE
jgi:low affinity Fe/Cu permease